MWRFPKMGGTSKSSILEGLSIIKYTIHLWRYPHLWKHPFVACVCLCIAYALPMHCLCIACALPMHCLCIACALPVHLEVPYVARPIRRFLPWNAWVLVVWNPVLPSWWFPKASMIQIDHYFLGWNQQPATMVSIIPLEDLSKWKGLAPSWGPQHHHVWTFIVYLINGGHASSIIPMPEDNTNIHIYI